MEDLLTTDLESSASNWLLSRTQSDDVDELMRLSRLPRRLVWQLLVWGDRLVTGGGLFLLRPRAEPTRALACVVVWPAVRFLPCAALSPLPNSLREPFHCLEVARHLSDLIEEWRICEPYRSPASHSVFVVPLTWPQMADLACRNSMRPPVAIELPGAPSALLGAPSVDRQSRRRGDA